MLFRLSARHAWKLTSVNAVRNINYITIILHHISIFCNVCNLSSTVPELKTRTSLTDGNGIKCPHKHKWPEATRQDRYVMPHNGDEESRIQQLSDWSLVVMKTQIKSFHRRWLAGRRVSVPVTNVTCYTAAKLHAFPGVVYNKVSRLWRSPPLLK